MTDEKPSSIAERQVDIAVLEVGLGGRLDATNVAEPLASAIVSIGHDHQAFLGDSLDRIAREKAGIMRRDRPTVVGPSIPPEARRAIDEESVRSGARLVEASAGSGVPASALVGHHMRENEAVA